MQIRNATEDDVVGITTIYNEVVEHTTAIWMGEKETADRRQVWLTGRQRFGFPVLVAVSDDGEVLGYSTYGAWRTVLGNEQTVEVSVYVRGDMRRRGIGSALLEALISHATVSRKHVMVSAIVADNGEAIGLHQKFGFEQVGIFKEVGSTPGRWLNLAFMQLKLDRREAPDD